MKHFFIIVNMKKSLAEKTSNAIREFLKDCGKETSCKIWDGPRQKKYELPEGTDCIITIGGDGTLIQAVRATMGSGVPVIGFNRGHLGYLTQLSKGKDIAPAMKRLLEEDYSIEERMMLKARVYRNGKCIYRDVALNEVLLSRYDSLRTIHFKVYVNETCLNDYGADGLIVATPTGSTAYSLSAGGPIAEPEAKMMIMTPICSHELNARSIVLEPEDEVRIEVYGDGQVAAFDGDTFVELGEGDQLVIRRSAIVTPMIRLKQISFMQNLSNHMSGRI